MWTVIRKVLTLTLKNLLPLNPDRLHPLINFPAQCQKCTGRHNEAGQVDFVKCQANSSDYEEDSYTHSHNSRRTVSDSQAVEYLTVRFPIWTK